MRVSKPAGDTGEADQRVAEALSAFAHATGSEHAALAALAATRLLVPVVAFAAEANEDGAEKESEMAIPTLIGNDGRKAVIAFTGTAALRRWKDDARPVPVPASRVWAAALGEADAVVIDVAGPVPLAVEGARLRALANGEPPPLPHEDPDIRAEVAAVTPDFALGPGGPDSDLVVTLKTADMDHARQIALRLAARCRRGIEIRTFLSERPRLTPAVPPLTPRSRPSAHPPIRPSAHPPLLLGSWPTTPARVVPWPTAPTGRPGARAPGRRMPVNRSGEGTRRSYARVRDNRQRDARGGQAPWQPFSDLTVG